MSLRKDNGSWGMRTLSPVRRMQRLLAGHWFQVRHFFVPNQGWAAVYWEMQLLDATPHTWTDADLLRAWSARHSQHSFRALVEKYLGLVQGVALRRTGDADLAADIAQAVFTRLAAKAGKINAEPTLAPWLHHCAWCEATSALRRESSRQRHLKAYAHHLQTTGSSPKDTMSEETLPQLDAALQALPQDDQRIVLMRYYEGRGLRDIAGILGKTEAAVRKQGQRALEKMSHSLRRRGLALTAPAIAAGLGAALSQPVNAATLASVLAGALQNASNGVQLTLTDHLLTLMNTKTKSAVITATCMAVPLLWQSHRASKLEEKLEAAQAETTRRAQGPSQLWSDRPSQKNQTVPAPAAEAVAAAEAGGTTAWEAALKTADPLQRMARLAALMSTITPETAPQVAELFRKLRRENGGGQYETEQRQFLRAWGRLDGAAALADSMSDGNGKTGTPETMAALAGWAQSHPAAATVWLEAQGKDALSGNLTLGLIDGWSLTDFDAASAYAASLPRSTARDEFRNLLLQRALAAGVPEAQRWLTSIPADEHNQLYKQRAFDSLISSMMKRDPAAAATWISTMGRQTFMDGAGIAQVATHLAASSPPEAIRWLESLGMGGGKAGAGSANAYASVASAWSQQDQEALGTWLNAQKTHPAYDQMAAAHAAQVASTDAAAAMAWADTITDESTRSTTRDKAAQAILRAQGQAGHPLLATAGYTPDQISKLSNDTQEYGLVRKLILADYVKDGTAGATIDLQDVGITNGAGAMWLDQGEGVAKEFFYQSDVLKTQVPP